MPIQDLINKINEYTNDVTQFHSKTDIISNTANEIVNFVNNDVKTFTGNSMYINPEPIKFGLVGINKIIEDGMNSVFDDNIPNTNVEETIMKYIKDGIPTIDTIDINSISDQLKRKYDFFISFDIQSILKYPEKINQLPDILSSLGFSLLDFNFFEFPNMNPSQVISILNNIKDQIVEEVTIKTINPITIKIPLDFGITIDSPVGNSDELMNVMKDMISKKDSMSKMLSLPSMDFNAIQELFPKIDSNEIISSIQFPDVSSAVSAAAKTMFEVVLSSAVITPTNSAMPGGVPISEQIAFPGASSGINLSSGNLMDELLKAFQNHLQNATVINVSNYNGNIIPVSGPINIA